LSENQEALSWMDVNNDDDNDDSKYDPDDDENWDTSDDESGDDNSDESGDDNSDNDNDDSDNSEILMMTIRLQVRTIIILRAYKLTSV